LTGRERIQLSSSDLVGAREALLSFCRTGDPSARNKVEWLFFEKSEDGRSGQHGLRGLLSARHVRKRQVDEPVDRAIADTQAVLQAVTSEARIESIVSYVQRFRPTKDEPERAQAAVAALRALADGKLPSEPSPSTVEREALQEVVASSSLDTSRLARVIGLWDELAMPSQSSGAEVVASTVLLGLARLSSKRLATPTDGRSFPEPRKPAAGEQLYLRYLAQRSELVPDFSWPNHAWDEATMAEISRWIREKAVPAYKGESEDDAEEAEDDLGGDEEALIFEVGRRTGAVQQPLGTIEIDIDPQSESITLRTAEHLSSWEETVPPGANMNRRPPGIIFTTNPRVEITTGLGEGWNKWTESLGTDKAGWALTSLIAPVNHDAEVWVDAWSAELRRVRTNAAAAGILAKRETLESNLDAAIDRGDVASIQQLRAELKELTAAAKGAELPELEAVRSLLRLCTGRRTRDRVVEQVVLLPHHPLVLRLRRLADLVLRGVLRLIWTEGWPETGLEHLREALADWGLPEPLHFYGFWDYEPLVFDTWLDDSGLAVFGRLSEAQSNQATGLGVGEVARTVDRYLKLNRAAGDRLKLRFLGDLDAKWAMNVLEQLVDTRKSAFRADVMVAGADADLDDEIMRVQLGAEERARAFEMSDDGAPPRVRVRRVEKEFTGPVHLAITLGNAVPEFGPQADRQVPPNADRQSWDPSVLFAETVPRPDMNAFVVQDPSDELSVLAASAVGYARNGQLSVHVERYSFDETRVGAPLRKLHMGAHWLLLISRQPLHRAVQAAGEEVASLLDFRAFSERNRPVHVSVSVGAGQFQTDLARLEGMLRVLLGGSMPGLAIALVRAARRFVPGVAINAVGGTNTAQLEGLLGLILTQREIASPDHLVLSIDQHQELLSRRAGPIGDALLLRQTAASLCASVAESKFTRVAMSAASPVIGSAVRQVKSTLDKLEHMSVDHPLSFVPRHLLARAIASRIQLAADANVTAQLEPFLESVLNSKHLITIEPPCASSVHVWSISDETKDEMSSRFEIPVLLHGRSATLAKLSELASE
jgi:hypothetical protein